MVLVQVLGWSSRHEERIELATRMLGWPLDEVTRPWSRHGVGQLLYWGRNERAGGLALIEEHAGHRRGSGRADELLALAAAFQLLSGRPVDALAEAEPILARTRAGLLRGGHRGRAGAGHRRAGSGPSRSHPGVRAGRILGEAERHGRPRSDVVTQVLAMVELRAAARRPLRRRRRLRDGHRPRTWTRAGWFALMKARGRPADRRRRRGPAQLRRGVGPADRGRWPGPGGGRRPVDAGRRRAAGDGPAARRCCAAARVRVDVGLAWMMEPDGGAGPAWLLTWRSTRPAATPCSTRPWPWPWAAGTLALAVQGAATTIAQLGRAGLAAPAPAEPGRVGRRAPTPGVWPPRLPALARNDVEGLVAVAESFEALGALLFAAEALAAASAATLRQGSRRAADALGRRVLGPGRALPGGSDAGPGPGRTRSGAHHLGAGGRPWPPEGLASKEIAAPGALG